jgi:hypothetical protein
VQNKFRKVKMATTKPTLLRLRTTTVDKLRAVLETSAHRSMASLADEILDNELNVRLARLDGTKAAETMRSLANRNG